MVGRLLVSSGNVSPSPPSPPKDTVAMNTLLAELYGGSFYLYSEGSHMFTQQHYVALAALIHKRRVEIQAHPSIVEVQIRLNAINDLVIEMADLFDRDAPGKFKRLIFIEACCRDLRDA